MYCVCVCVHCVHAYAGLYAHIRILKLTLPSEVMTDWLEVERGERL